MDLNLETTFLGMPMPFPIVNGAGTVKTLEQVKKLAHPDVCLGGIEIGGVTIEKRDGNPSPNFHYFGYGSLNSLGLPNGGLEYYEPNLPEMVRMIHDSGKVSFLNICGFTPEESYRLTKVAVATGIKVATINTGCPNARVDGKRKPTIAFDPPLVSDHLAAAREAANGSNLKIGAKSSHFSDPDGRVIFINICVTLLIDCVLACNTSPDCFLFEGGKPAIGPNDGYGGLAGKAVKPSALAHVRKFREVAGEQMGIIGLGGVDSGDDIEDYLQAGANIVGLATELYRTDNDPGVLYRIIERLVTIRHHTEGG